MVLRYLHTLELLDDESGGFDHGDVFERSGFSFVAHTGTDSVEMYDGVKGVHLRTISGVPQASGVICDQKRNLAYAASRGTGKILVLDETGETVREFMVGTRPNGMAWDTRRQRLLAADVGDNHVRIVDPDKGMVLGDIPLSGRPRWGKYSAGLDRYVVNVHTPSELAIIDPESNSIEATIPISVDGPHGVDIDEKTGIAYIACDGGAIISVDIQKRKELRKVAIYPNPDVVWLNIKRGLLYSANSKNGVIQVVDIKEMRIVEEVATEEGCHTIAFHQESQTLHAYLSGSNRIAFYRED